MILSVGQSKVEWIHLGFPFSELDGVGGGSEGAFEENVGTSGRAIPS